MRKLLSIVLTLVMVISLLPINTVIVSANSFTGGNGTKESPYQISTAEQLNAIRNDLDAHYVLINDIDLSKYNNWVPIPAVSKYSSGTRESFTGTLDGNGYSIKNFSVNMPEDENNTYHYIGLFSIIATDAEVKNLNFQNPVINANPPWYSGNGTMEGVGVICGQSNGVITNCRINNAKINTLNSMRTGILCGWASGTSNVNNCIADNFSIIADVGNTGGICGESNTKITNCHAKGTINISGQLNKHIGGCVGKANKIADSSSDVTIYVRWYGDSYKELKVGGLAGQATKIYGCKTNGDITVSLSRSDEVYIGGMCGVCTQSVEKSHAIGNITLEQRENSGIDYDIGGLVGITDGNDVIIDSCLSQSNINTNVTRGGGTANGLLGELSSKSTTIKNCFIACNKINNSLDSAYADYAPYRIISPANSWYVLTLENNYALDSLKLNGSIATTHIGLNEANGKSANLEQIKEMTKDLFIIEDKPYTMNLFGAYDVELDNTLEIDYAVKQGEEYVHNELDIEWEIENNDIIKFVSDKESAYTNILTIKGLNMGECDLVAKVDGSEIGRTKIYCEGSLAETIDNETILRAKVLVNNGAYNYDKSSKHIYETMIEGTNLTSAKIYDKISNIKKIVTGQYVDYNKIALLGMIECDESIKIYGDLGDLIKNDVAKHAVKKAYKKGLKEGTKLDENIDWSNVSEISKNTKKEYAAEVCKDLVGDKNKVLDIGILNSISMATSSTEAFINAFSTAYAYSIVTDEKIAVLESIKNNTTNSDLKAAATEIIAEIKDAKANKIKSFAQKPTAAGIKALFEETSDIVIDEIVDAIIDKGIKAGATSAAEKAAMAASIVKGVKIGYEVGTTVSDILFKADDLSGDLLTLAAICDIEYSMEKAMDSAENSFNKKQTIETADKLIAHAQLYKSLLIYGHQATAGMVENVKQAKENQQSPLLDMFGLVGQSIKGWCLLLSGNDNTNYDVTITNIKNTEKEIISHDYFSLGDVNIAEYLREVKSTAISDWAKVEVNKAIKLGILPDYMQNNYQNNITRAEFCTILTNLITTKTGKTIDELIKEKGKQLVSPFKDTYYVYADYMCKLGIVNGVSATEFNPLGEITREQAATMLMRTADVLGYDTSYNTSVESGVSSWATEGVGFVTENGIMNGTGNGFEPQGKYTKEQAIATFVRMYDNLK